MTLSEGSGDPEPVMQWLQRHVTPPMNRAFEGMDMIANLTEDIPDFWGIMDLALTPDALPLLPSDTPRLPTPLDTGYLHTVNGTSIHPTFEHSLFSTHELEEPFSSSDLAALYRISISPLADIGNSQVDPDTRSTLTFSIRFYQS